MPDATITLRTRADLAAIQQMDAAFQDLSKQEQKATKDALALAQSFARLDAALGNPAEGARRLQATLQGLGAAPAKSVASVEAQIANLNSRAQQGTPIAQQFGDAFKSSLLNIVGPAAVATAALGAVKGAFDLALAGENTAKVNRAFEQLAGTAHTTGDELLRALRAASGGQISDLNLELATNKGLLLGVADNAKTFGDLMLVARDRAAKLGTDATQAFDDITTGIGRESPRILDNLGIIVDADAANKAYATSIGKTVDQLTKSERIHALTAAVIKQGKDGLDAESTTANDAASQTGKLGTAFENLKDKAGVLLNSGLNAVSGALNAYDDALIRNSGNAQNFGQAQDSVYITTVKGTGALQLHTEALVAAAAARDAENGRITVSIDALSADAVKRLDSQQASAKLAAEQAQLEKDSIRAANGMLGAGDQALILAQKYGIATSQAQFLIQQQQALANKTALADQRKGEITGTDLTAAQFDAFSKLRRQREQEDAAEKKRADEKAAADAKRLQDAVNQGRIINAKTSTAKIAEYQRQLNAATDPVDRQRLQNQIDSERIAAVKQGISAAKTHTSELQKQQTLTESIYDSENKRKQALIDIQRLGAEDTLQDLKDKQDRRVFQNFLNSGRGSQDFRTAAAAQLDLINAKDADRGLKLDEARATAGAGLSSRGTLLQSRAGGVPAAAAAGNAPPSAAGVPTATTLSGGGTQQQGVIFMDGKQVGTVLFPLLHDELVGAIKAIAAQRGL